VLVLESNSKFGPRFLQPNPGIGCRGSDLWASSGVALRSVKKIRGTRHGAGMFYSQARLRMATVYSDEQLTIVFMLF
jgi:hypothetical protein